MLMPRFFISALNIGCCLTALAASRELVTIPVPPHPTTKPNKAEVADIEFSLQRRDEKYEVGLPIMVDATLRNLRQKQLIVLERRGVAEERNCFPVVRDAENRQAPFTEFGKKLCQRLALEDLRTRSIPLDKDQTIESVLELTKIYDLSRPGRYTVQATRYVFRDDGRYALVIESNVVEISVVAK